MRRTFNSLVIAAFAASAAHGATWVSQGKWGSGSTLYVDADSLRTATKSGVWVKIDHKTRTISDAERQQDAWALELQKRGMLAENNVVSPFSRYRKPSEQKLLWKFNCAERKMVTIDSVTYDQEGEVMESKEGRDIPSNYSRVAPDTVAEAVMNLVC